MHYTVTANITINAKTSSDASSKVENLLIALLDDEKIYDYIVRMVRPDVAEAIDDQFTEAKDEA